MTYRYYDFFAGGGMAGVGLGAGWACVFANDFNAKKAAIYRCNNRGGSEFMLGDVATVTTADLPGEADLAWASFPCQDLSVAGARRGLRGGRSSAFWPFWDLMRALETEARAPRMIVLENVCGALTSHGGADFAALANAFSDFGYTFGAVVMDAKHFVPQSRPRLFVIGVRGDLAIPTNLYRDDPSPLWHSAKLRQTAAALPKGQTADTIADTDRDTISTNWRWWDMPAPPKRNTTLSAIIEDAPRGVPWRNDTDYLLSLMTPTHRDRVTAAQRAGRPIVGTVFRRTRTDSQGQKRQRAEVRFDDISGCLRTPSGGSSRQIMLLIDGDSVRSRLLSPREAARLMGLPEDYQLPDSTNAALHLAGDGVVAPVVRHIAAHLLEPILAANDRHTVT